MSKRYLLDTNVISEPVQVIPNTGVMARLRVHFSEVVLPSVVVHELVYGLEKMTEGKRKRELAEYVNDLVLGVFQVVPYGEEAAIWHARERARLEKEGVTRPFVDGQIAAIAATNGLVLVTRNEKDFQYYDGLVIENWHKD